MRFFTLSHASTLALIGEPVELDTTHINSQIGRKFYAPQVMDAYVESDGSKWVDIMVNGRASVYFYTENVLNSCLSNQISGIEFYPVRLTRSNNKKLPIETAPVLFWGRVTGTIEAIKSGSGYNDIEYKLEVSKWSGDDVFLIGNQKINTIFCTSKFIKMAAIAKLTGFCFRPIPEDNRYRFSEETAFAPLPYLNKNFLRSFSSSE
jgi:hypothetical protein